MKAAARPPSKGGISLISLVQDGLPLASGAKMFSGIYRTKFLLTIDAFKSDVELFFCGKELGDQLISGESSGKPPTLNSQLKAFYFSNKNRLCSKTLIT